MPPPVFISYSRGASAPHAQALAARLGDLAFLDTSAIDDGDQFPERLLDAILDSRVVVVFATQAYSQSRFCRLEMRLALAGGDAAASHLILALGPGCDAVLDVLPTAVTIKAGPKPGRRSAWKRWCAGVWKAICPRFVTDLPPAKHRVWQTLSMRNRSSRQPSRSTASSARFLQAWPGRASERA